MSKGLRYYVMISSAAIAEMLTFIFLWLCTSCEIFTVLFWMMVVALAVGGTAWYLTDPKRKPWSPKNVPIINLDRESYRRTRR